MAKHFYLVTVLIGLLLPAVHAQGTLSIPSTPAAIAAGKKLVFSKSKGNCIACHLVKGAVMAGDIAQPLEPPFPTPGRLYTQIWDARENYGSNTIMPPYGANHILNKTQIKEIMAFLYSLD